MFCSFGCSSKSTTVDQKSHPVEQNTKTQYLIEDELLKVILPEGWKIYNNASLIKARGIHGELLLASVHAYKGDAPQSAIDELRNRWIYGFKNGMKQAANTETIKEIRSLKEMQLNGYPFISVYSETIDGKGFLGQYGIIGPRAALLITVEGWVKDSEYACKTVEEMISNIIWGIGS